jgi:flagellar motor switch protein FliG
MQRLTKARELKPLETLQRADPQKLARFLEGEHPQTIALILGQLGDRQASALLMSLPNEVRAEAVKRLANLRRFSPEMAEKVSVVLSQRLKAVGEQGKRAYSGFQSVADIMNCIDTTVAQEILENIENEEPTLAISIRDLMFTFEDFCRWAKSQIRELTGAIDKRGPGDGSEGNQRRLEKPLLPDHVVAGRSKCSRKIWNRSARFAARMSSRRRLRLLRLPGQLETEGKIVLKGEGNDEYVV